MPDVDIVVVDATHRSHTYQIYWNGDSFLDQDSCRLLTTNVSALRALVKAVTPSSD